MPRPILPARASRPRPSERTILLGALGACVAALAWLATGALTGLGKGDDYTLPLVPVVAIVGTIVAVSRWRVFLWIASLVVFTVYGVVALTPFATRGLRPSQLVRRDSLPAHPLDAVVVLSGGITPDSLLHPEALDRLLTGLALMRDSVAPILVLTQPRRREDGVTAAQDQARVRDLVARSFPVLVVDSVYTTRDEAVNAWRILRPRMSSPDVRIAVVTSPLHTRRSCATFETVGFTVTCIPATARGYSLARASSAADRLALFRAWLYERAAWTEYRARRWVRP
jgi:uncharacterized SAM-binding protein YcdF (DUF218 family)